MSLVISVNGLRESYGEFVAISDVSFEVEEGEIFGILGPSGVSKTTAVESPPGISPASFDGGQGRRRPVDLRFFRPLSLSLLTWCFLETLGLPGVLHSHELAPPLRFSHAL